MASVVVRQHSRSFAFIARRIPAPRPFGACASRSPDLLPADWSRFRERRLRLRGLSLLSALLVMAAPLHAEEPVKIYILAGQFNMQGKGPIEGDGSNSLRYMLNNDPKKEFQSLVNDNGEWVERNDVWVHYDLYPWGGLRHGPLKPGYGSTAGQIGPELGFGHVIGDATEEQVLLIQPLPRFSITQHRQLSEACLADGCGLLLSPTAQSGARGHRKRRHLFSRLQGAGCGDRRDWLAPGLERPIWRWQP